MRPHHTPHPLSSFPVYSCAFLSANKFVLGGGGGASRSGIKNKLRLYAVNEDRAIQLKDEFELEKGEDAPMSMAAHAECKTIICGVNSVQEKMEKGENENCRVFSIADDKILLICTKSTLSGSDVDDYQKVTTISPDGSILAVAGSHDLTLLSFPSLSPITAPIHTDKEIYDVSFSSDSLVLATTHNLLVYALPESRSSTKTSGKVSTSPKKSKKKHKSANKPNASLRTLKLEQKVNFPASFVEGGTFRAVRYHPLDESILYTAINASVSRSKASKGPSRQGYVLKWNTKTWTVDKSRKVGDRGLTSFDISPDGRFLAYGSSDLSIGMLDTRLLGPCASILKAFEFPPTLVKFNPTTTLLVACSADNSIRVVSIPADVSSSSFLFFFSIVFAILVVLLAVAVRFYGLNVLSW